MLQIDNGTLGFPRMGPNRELKFALEKFWHQKIKQQQLYEIASQVEENNWKIQLDQGIQRIGVGFFSLYDHVLDWTFYLGCAPKRFQHLQGLEKYFVMARGKEGIPALDMTKWFDTNYHYEVPELDEETLPQAHFEGYLDTVTRALRVVGPNKAVPIILGPLTYLSLSKFNGSVTFESMLDKILPLYALLLEKLIEMGIREIQIHEPSLVTSTASSRLVSLLPMVYGLNKKKGALEKRNLSIDLVTYFEEIDHQVYEWFLESNISALSLDFTRGNNLAVLEKYGFPQGKRLGAGLIDGRNIWKLNPTKILNDVESIKRILSGSSSSSRNDIFMTIQPSCSLQHVPFTKESEFGLIKDDSSCRGLFGVLSFACEKLQEIQLVTKVALESETLSNLFEDTKNAWELFYQHNPSKPQVQSRLQEISEADLKRPSVFSERRPLQLKGLPILPTTTIGSFPQTPQLRTLRRQLKKGDISVQSYEARINEQIAFNIGIQEALGLDILVHGEPERTDMVEYFAEKIEGFAFTSNAWVQSYGSRCVRPPIIYADLERPHPMTVREFQVAQSFTSKPVKGMLTGPVTILNWSFPRLDISRQEQAFQLALCLREEVADLENAQCQVIQVDEPALREGMPLKKVNKDTYLKWAVDAFRLSTAVAKDTTSIHTHMCYCEFGDCLAAIDALDADVNSIENARSDDETIRDFKSIHYERDLGPGTYDIDSPVVPSKQQIVHKLESFLKLLPAKQVVVNPDCGLKTRQWPETIAALRNMVDATLQVRKQLKVCT